MKTVLYAAVAALSLAAVPAFAGEGNGDPFPSHTTGMLTANLPTRDVGAAQLPSYATPMARDASLAVTEGGVLPPNQSVAGVDTANSLPRQ